MTQTDRAQAAEVDDGQRLQRSLHEPRTLLSALLSTITGAATIIACIPLFSVLIMLLWRGAAKLSWHLFVELPPTPFEDGGGFGNAIQGTLAMVLIPP
jgi:phosphate transport system permease protein